MMEAVILLPVEAYISYKEMIASIIFDFEGEDYVRPHEEDCHALAEKILEALQIGVEGIDRG